MGPNVDSIAEESILEASLSDGQRILSPSFFEAANQTALPAENVLIEEDDEDEDDDALDEAEDEEEEEELVMLPFAKPDLLTCISEENLFENNLDVIAAAEDEREEELRGMLGGKGSYSEPDLSRICDDECEDCEDDLRGHSGLHNGLHVDSGLTRQSTWHHFAAKNNNSVKTKAKVSRPSFKAGQAAVAAAAAAERLPAIAEVTSFV